MSLQIDGANNRILDTNGNEAVKVEVTASAVNEITLANAATGNGPAVKATGDNTDIDLNLTPKGAGLVKIGGNALYPLGNQVATGSITNAEALALRATPKTLVAAAGAGKVLEFVSLALFFDWTAAYTESTANLGVKYTNGSGAQVSETIEATGFADAVADTMTVGVAKNDQLVAKTGCDNQALVLHNLGAGEWGGGNASNVIRYVCVYRVDSPGW